MPLRSRGRSRLLEYAAFIAREETKTSPSGKIVYLREGEKRHGEECCCERLCLRDLTKRKHPRGEAGSCSKMAVAVTR